MVSQMWDETSRFYSLCFDFETLYCSSIATKHLNRFFNQTETKEIIMTILVTGATGTVGREVVEQLVKRGADVKALVRDPSKANFPASVGVVQGDMLDVDSLRRAFSGVSTLFLLNAVV